MNGILRDVRYAVHQFFKSPGFTVVAVITLALGLGANTAIFSLIDAVMMKMLPVKNPEQLVLFQWHGQLPPQTIQSGGSARFAFSFPAFEQFHAKNQTLQSVFAFVRLGFTRQNTTVSVNGEPTLANGMMVSGGYFSGLGVNPLLGRGIREEDEPPSAPRVAVISYGYWTDRFARDSSILGKNVAVNGIPFTIVGVAPPAFQGAQPGTASDVWIAFADRPNLRPLGMKPPKGLVSAFTAHNWICVNIMGRLKPGVNKHEAEAALDVVFGRFLTADWTPDKSSQIAHIQLTPAGQGLNYYLRQKYSQPLYLLMSIVGIVLLIGCANLATLLLARATARQREISVRVALGASRVRLVRQLMTESVLLAVIGGVLGLLVANWGTHTLLTLMSSGDNPIVVNVKPDPVILSFTFLISLCAGLLFGIAPAFCSVRVDLALAMKENASDLFEGKGVRLGKLLVVMQVAASLVLIIGAGLFLRTLRNLEDRDLGFNQEKLLLFALDPTRGGYTGDRLINFYSGLLERIHGVPGVMSATLCDFAPLSDSSSNLPVHIHGMSRTIENAMVRWGKIGPDFLRTMQIPLVLGRDISPGDTSNSPKVALVDETFVHHFFGKADPIGYRFSFDFMDMGKDQFEIVGVVRNAELTDLHATPVPKAYIPYMQMPDGLGIMYFEVRTTRNPMTLIPSIRNVVHQSDPSLPLMNLKTQVEQTSEALTQERLFARLSSFFSFLALLLACIGLYGTLAYSVTRKTREIGIRMALGARPIDVLRWVVSQGLELTLIGIIVGIVTAIAITRLIGSMVYGITATDPLTFLAGSALLVCVALLACYLPARRAAKVHPMTALRYE